MTITEEQRRDLAAKLHGLFCHADHTEGCAWHYHPKDWDNYDHKTWLRYADEVLLIVDQFYPGPASS